MEFVLAETKYLEQMCAITEQAKAQLKNMDNSQQTEIALDDINGLRETLSAE